MKSNIILIVSAFVLGIILTVFTYQAVTIYQLRGESATDHTTILQIVNFLNQNIQQAQQAQQAQNAAVAPSQRVQLPSPATSSKK
jgi:Tfp pilus assembly protein PilE